MNTDSRQRSAGITASAIVAILGSIGTFLMGAVMGLTAFMVGTTPAASRLPNQQAPPPLAPEAPYPACVQDANYAVRWLKTNAAKWRGSTSRVGVYGSSSGGHVAELLAMRPRDPRYNTIPLRGGPESPGGTVAPNVDATVAFVAMRSPVSNPFARFKNAEDMKREPMMNNHKTFFVPWDTIHESNPQEILERHEKVTLVPFLIMQGALDDNVRPAVQEKFAQTYKAAGGDVEFHVFENCEHEWVAKPGPQTDRAREMVKAFIARQVNR